MEFDTSTILNERYKLQQKFGIGGFSEVWRALDQQSQQEVAIKVSKRHDKEGIRMCEEEFKRTTRLRHDRLIRLLDFNVHESAPYLVMPFYPQRTLENRVGEVDEATTWRVIRDIGSGLQYIHSLEPPITHNDIKPDNFLIDDKGGFILTDFGISTEPDDKMPNSHDSSEHGSNDGGAPKSRAHGVAPTAYRAPELFTYGDRLKQDPVKCSDIWAFGACLHELITGTPPFGEEGGRHQLMKYQENGTMVPQLVAEPIPDNYSTELIDTVYSCLSYHTWHRPSAEKLVETATRNLKRIEKEGPAKQTPIQPTKPTAGEGRNFKPEYKKPDPIERPSLKKPAPVRESKMPILLWILGLLALAAAVFFALTHFFPISEANSSEQKTIGAVQSNEQPGLVATMSSQDTQQTQIPEVQVPVKQKEEEKTNKPSNSNIINERQLLGPPSPKNIGRPSTSAGFHLVILGTFNKTETRSNIRSLKKAFPNRNIWATDLGLEQYKIKLGSFPNEESANAFQAEISIKLKQFTAFDIRPNQ